MISGICVRVNAPELSASAQIQKDKLPSFKRQTGNSKLAEEVKEHMYQASLDYLML